MFLEISLLHSQCLRSGPDYFMNVKYELYRNMLHLKHNSQWGKWHRKKKKKIVVTCGF